MTDALGKLSSLNGADRPNDEQISKAESEFEVAFINLMDGMPPDFVDAAKLLARSQRLNREIGRLKSDESSDAELLKKKIEERASINDQLTKAMIQLEDSRAKAEGKSRTKVLLKGLEAFAQIMAMMGEATRTQETNRRLTGEMRTQTDSIRISEAQLKTKHEQLNILSSQNRTALLFAALGLAVGITSTLAGGLLWYRSDRLHDQKIEAEIRSAFELPSQSPINGAGSICAQTITDLAAAAAEIKNNMTHQPRIYSLITIEIR